MVDISAIIGYFCAISACCFMVSSPNSYTRTLKFPSNLIKAFLSLVLQDVIIFTFGYSFVQSYKTFSKSSLVLQSAINSSASIKNVTGLSFRHANVSLILNPHILLISLSSKNLSARAKTTFCSFSISALHKTDLPLPATP